MSFSENAEAAIPGIVHMLSGCKDTQTSADVGDVATFELPEDCGPGGAGGACTSSMMKVLTGGDVDGLSWVGLLQKMHAILAEEGYTQLPQLSSSRQLSLDAPFTISDSESGGKRRALLIGINYVGQQGELRGCHNDVVTMAKYIASQGFVDGEVKVLMDDGEHEEPTFDNIIAGFDWLTDGAAAGDSFFLHYSGHGGSVRDTDGDERDGKDETLIPVDYKTKGQITDDVILANLVLDVPAGAMLTAVIDACHSGSALDLPYQFVASTGALEDVKSGSAPGQLGETPGFGFSQLLGVGKMLFAMQQAGKTKQEIATAALAGLKKAGALEAVQNVMAGYSKGGDGGGAPTCPCTVL